MGGLRLKVVGREHFSAPVEALVVAEELEGLGVLEHERGESEAGLVEDEDLVGVGELVQVAAELCEDLVGVGEG